MLQCCTLIMWCTANPMLLAPSSLAESRLQDILCMCQSNTFNCSTSPCATIGLQAMFGYWTFSYSGYMIIPVSCTVMAKNMSCFISLVSECHYYNLFSDSVEVGGCSLFSTTCSQYSRLWLCGPYSAPQLMGTSGQQRPLE